MNILIHSPLHPSIWIYLIKSLPEHNWYVEPRINFQEGQIPYGNLNLKVLPKDGKIKVDAQIICVHSKNKKRILQKFNLPIIWIEYWRNPYKFPMKKNYPVISTSRTNHRENYNNLRFSYFSPTKDIWNENWKGDENVVFCPVRRFYKDPEIRKIINYLEKRGIPLKLFKSEKRNIPFNEWKNYFVHSRVLFEATKKFTSANLSEAMFIGMPVVTLDYFDFKKIIRNNVDGFRSNSIQKIYIYLRTLLDNYSFAQKMGERAKRRASNIYNPDKQRKVWNQAFEDAIKEFNE